MANVSSSNGLKKYPKLRFPEFDEPYRKCQIGDIYVERGQRGAGDMELLSVTMNDGVMPRSEIEGKDNSSEDKSNYKVVRKDDMVYNSMRMWQGANGVSNYDGIVSPAYTVLMPIEEIDNRYFAALFKTSNLINEFRKKSQGLTSDTWNLKYPQIRPIRLYIPSLREQHKISAFIDALEERIGKQRQLVDALKKYKRGVSNAIFSRKIRFKQKDGTEYPEWDTKQLSELMEFKNGVNAQKDAFLKGNIKCIGVSDVYSGKPIYSCNIMGSIKLDSDQKREFLVEYGDVLFQRSSETQEDIGHAAVYVDESQMSVFNGFVIRGKKKAEYDPWFLHYELQTSDVRKQTIRLGAGAQHYNIGQESLASIIVRLPSADEQNKIAHLLKSIDARITVEESKIKTLQMAKDRLMQKLFV